MLDRIMAGAKPGKLDHVVAPIAVVTRKSTDVLAIQDEVTASAMNFIRDKAHLGINVSDVVDAIGMSRSTLESRFRDSLGRTVHEVIRRIQLDHARRLVSETSLAMKEIAANTGFRSVQHMTSLFGRSFGATPARYRKELIR